MDSQIIELTTDESSRIIAGTFPNVNLPTFPNVNLPTSVTVMPPVKPSSSPGSAVPICNDARADDLVVDTPTVC